MARNATAETLGEDRSLGTIIKELTADISTLFRSEIALLKLEVKDTVAKLSGGVAMFLGAAFLGIFGLGLFVIAGGLAMMGRKKFAAVQFVPTESIAQIKTDIETIKNDIARVRSQ